VEEEIHLRLPGHVLQVGADGRDEEFGPAGMRRMRAQNGVTGCLDIFFRHPLLAVLLT
jgi:hypothetical protein